MLVLFQVSVGAEPAAAGKKLLSIEDLYLFDAPAGVRLAPDGKRAVYVRQWIDPATKRDRHSLWVVDGKKENAKPLEAGEPDARAPIWSPDGKWIAFLSTRSRPKDWKQTPPVPAASDPATDIWLLPTGGGASIPLAGSDKPYGRVFNDGFYGRIGFSPDGRRLVFVADDGKDARSPEEIAANVTVVRPDQGESYTGYGPAQVWIAHLDAAPGQCAARQIDRLTNDDVWYGDPRWSPDGKSIVVHANKTADRESARFSINKNFDLWSIDPETRGSRQLTFGPGPEVSPRFSPDGKRLACLSGPRKGTHMDVFNLAIVTLDEHPHADIVADFHKSDSRFPQAPIFPLREDCWEDNEHLVYTFARGVGNATVRVSVAAGPKVNEPSGKNGAENPQTRRRQMEQRRLQLTPAGNLFLKERQLSDVKIVIWANEGRTLEGILTVPPAAVATPPYKLLLYPHGGPHSRTTAGFDFNAQVFAAQGYAVFQPNYRGSAGYGQAFIDADHFDFGGGDMRDILSGVEQLIKQKLVDRHRQFVYGTSYGGYMTCWLVGHTRQFRAAVAQNAVTDLNAMWGLSDIQSWTEWEFGGRPWEVPGAMRDHSPITYVANVRTPTLILHSRDDRRVPLPMGRMYYQSLLARGVPTQMVIYADEGHAIRQPRHREDVLRRTLAWFAKYDEVKRPTGRPDESPRP
jgi:dipeptidyl aminopeptidase/acylaminoacyl peptidase